MSKGVRDIYWVVGGNTNVGKTTISAALIRVLDRAGRKVSGFKPHASTSLMSLYGTLLGNGGAAGSSLFGTDALKLATASSMTSADLADVIVPIQHISYPRHKSTFITRVGSPTLRNDRYYRKVQPDGLMDRPDIKYLIESAKIPYDKCAVVEDVEFESSALLGMDAPRASFEYLLNLGVDTVVCEGAAGYLPIWQGAPPVTHIFFIDGYGHINYFHNINLEIIFDQDRPMQSFEVLTNIINGRSLGFVRSPLYLAREEKIDAVSESMVLDIFRHLKLL